MKHLNDYLVLGILTLVFISLLSEHEVGALSNNSGSQSVDIHSESGGKLSEQLRQSIVSQLIGHWRISDTFLTADGKWQAGAGASWHFYPILNGHAIQDDWISPPLDAPEPATERQYGTNLRIYNPAKEQWEMAWTSNQGPQITMFTAKESSSELIMSGFYAGAESEITFYDIQPNQFSWKLSQQQSDGQWQEIYRIEAVRQDR